MASTTRPRFTKHKLDQHGRLLAELPNRAQEAQDSISRRIQMRAATQAYILKLERDRVHRHLTAMPNALQQLAAQDNLGDLDRRVHRLAQTGLP